MRDARRLGIIGYGRVAQRVACAVQNGCVPGWTIAGVLGRHARIDGALHILGDPDEFFSRKYDLIIEAAGPSAFRTHGVRAIHAAHVWTISGAALCDDEFSSAIASSGEISGHRLRVFPGAIAGVDGVAIASVDPNAIVRLVLVLPPDDACLPGAFVGTVRQAARRLPNSVNVAVGAALVGRGIDATTVEIRPAEGRQRRLMIAAESRFGNYSSISESEADSVFHPAAARLLEALKQELEVIWVG